MSKVSPLAQASLAAQQGLPVDGVTPAVSQGPSSLPQVLAMLKAGQLSAGQLLQFISALVGANGQAAPPDESGSPIEEAFMQGGQQ